MSQHRFKTTLYGHPITVLLGWDRPLGHYFMVIEWDGPQDGMKPSLRANEDDDDDDTILYSNLNEPQPFRLPLTYFEAKLAELGIRVPHVMFRQVEIDRQNNTGNRVVWYDTDGPLRNG